MSLEVVALKTVKVFDDLQVACPEDGCGQTWTAKYDFNGDCQFTCNDKHVFMGERVTGKANAATNAPQANPQEGQNTRDMERALRAISDSGTTFVDLIEALDGLPGMADPSAYGVSYEGGTALPNVSLVIPAAPTPATSQADIHLLAQPPEPASFPAPEAQQPAQVATFPAPPEPVAPVGMSDLPIPAAPTPTPALTPTPLLDGHSASPTALRIPIAPPPASPDEKDPQANPTPYFQPPAPPEPVAPVGIAALPIPAAPPPPHATPAAMENPFAQQARSQVSFSAPPEPVAPVGIAALPIPAAPTPPSPVFKDVTVGNLADERTDRVQRSLRPMPAVQPKDSRDTDEDDTEDFKAHLFTKRRAAYLASGAMLAIAAAVIAVYKGDEPDKDNQHVAAPATEPAPPPLQAEEVVVTDTGGQQPDTQRQPPVTVHCEQIDASPQNWEVGCRGGIAPKIVGWVAGNQRKAILEAIYREVVMTARVELPGKVESIGNVTFVQK